MDYQIGDIVTLKKQHPCGSKQWEILRVGADFRLKCQGCGHQIMIARKLVEKNTEKGLKIVEKRGNIYLRDILFLAPYLRKGPETKRR